ncbi:MAG: bifunctional DNA-formamidopyrimidine glycosylase/DNA-(apurinic or apyrimidinic site) lyase [Candidatus Pacebacteria bacterium]|nr:bifunctional DNA-formamidopyrimidine glycosylase/DNA-(apurinic or apyrimidinic site) lyase [Candidatus Paceibacterota bacterium]
MPELPEVETVCRGLAQFLVGQRISSVTINRRNLRLEIPYNLGQVMTGRTVTSIKRRAKFIVLEFDHAAVIIHLGMSGSIQFKHRGNPPRSESQSKHDHVVWQIDSSHPDQSFQIIYNDPRRFGLIQVSDSPEWQNHPILAQLGLEPLDSSFTPAILKSILQDRKTAIKQLLLDQSAVVGIGNIYAAEALFMAGISPLRPSNQIKPSEVKKLHRAIQTILHNAIAAGGSSLKDFVQPSGELGYFQHSWSVYGRKGQKCPGCDCTGAIEQFEQNGRSSFWCRHKQV